MTSATKGPRTESVARVVASASRQRPSQREAGSSVRMPRASLALALLSSGLLNKAVCGVVRIDFACATGCDGGVPARSSAHVPPARGNRPP
jgi:hypothetical protein